MITDNGDFFLRTCATNEGRAHAPHAIRVFMRAIIRQRKVSPTLEINRLDWRSGLAQPLIHYSYYESSIPAAGLIR